MTTKIPAELSSTPGIADSSDATAITITSAEKVGIGTANPSQLLTIESNSFPILQISNTLANNPTDGAALDIVEKQDGYAASTATFGQTGVYGYRLKLNGSTNELILQSGSQTTTADRVTVDRDTGNVTLDTGNLVIGTSGKGIDFSANANESGMTSELLDDYEEGTFTAGITGASGHAYSAQTATYTKIGRLVVANFTYVLSTAPTSGSNIYVVMPFVPTGSSTYSFGAPYSRISFPAGQTDESAIMLCTYAGTVNFYPYDRSSGAVYISYTNHAVGQYSCTVTYFTDS